MGFTEDLAAISAKQDADRIAFAKLQTDAAKALTDAQAASADVTTKFDALVASGTATHTMVQTALDEIAALTKALAGNPPPVVP